MPTPHISASRGQIAKTVLMPGDPLRAKMIAQTFLESPALFSEVRGMFGYTGTFQGKPVSVMGSGMGMPSMGIYSYELFTEYGVENIIRVGSAGSYLEELNLYDVVLVSSAWSESSYAHTMSGFEERVVYPSAHLNKQIEESAKALGIPVRLGAVHCTDVFYCQPWQGEHPPYWQGIRDQNGCIAVEMESFALFHNAAATGKNAACLLTISDNLATRQLTTSEEREKSFLEMIKVALGVL